MSYAAQNNEPVANKERAPCIRRSGVPRPDRVARKSGPSSSSRRYGRGVAALPPDYDSDPDRSGSFQLGWQEDVHGPVAERLIARGTQSVVDVGCGIGRLGAALDGRIGWIGVDNSPKQLRDCLRRPVVTR